MTSDPKEGGWSKKCWWSKETSFMDLRLKIKINFYFKYFKLGLTWKRISICFYQIFYISLLCKWSCCVGGNEIVSFKSNIVIWISHFCSSDNLVMWKLSLLTHRRKEQCKRGHIVQKGQRHNLLNGKYFWYKNFIVVLQKLSYLVECVHDLDKNQHHR